MRLPFILFFSCIFIAVLNPEITVQGAGYGLSTWLYGLVPTLLPFMILANLILSPDFSSRLKDSLPSVLKKNYAKICVCFNIIAGITFGLPIGAKVTTILLKNKIINSKQGQILLNHCNTIGPAFVGGFLLTKCLHRSHWLLPTLCILYLPQFLSVIIHFRFYPLQKKQYISKEKKETSRLKYCFQLLDISIKNGFETIMVLGGYLLLFGILCAYTARLPLIPDTIKAYLLSLLEITSGMQELSLLPVVTEMKYLLSLPLVTFGGLCTLMQTKSIINGYPLSIRSYFYHKLIFSCITVILTSIYLFILY